MFEELKESIRDILRPLAKKITDINPNTLTLFGLLLSLISAYFFARWELKVAGAFLLAGGFFDALDGLVARENNRMTKFGGFLDSVCDRFADAAVILGAMYGGLSQGYSSQYWLIGTLAIFSSLMVSYTRARAEAAGASASVGFGMWHFFVPKAWKWYSYIDINATELVAAVRAINVFFSFSGSNIFHNGFPEDSIRKKSIEITNFKLYKDNYKRV